MDDPKPELRIRVVSENVVRLWILFPQICEMGMADNFTLAPYISMTADDALRVSKILKGWAIEAGAEEDEQ